MTADGVMTMVTVTMRMAMTTMLMATGADKRTRKVLKFGICIFGSNKKSS